MPDTAVTTDFLARLRSAVGADQVLDRDEDTRTFCTDWRGAYRGRPIAVVRPASTAEISRVIRLAAAADVGVVPQGGNTGLVGGATPHDDRSEIVLSLARLRRVRALDRDNATISLDAGVTLAEAQHAAADAGFLFPLSLASEGSCSIGGNLSTNAGGTAVLRYGNVRKLTLGLEVVLADGRVWDGMRSLRKDNTGYDMKQVFIGAEGTLGVISGAVLELFPMPRSSATALVGVRGIEDAAAVLRLLRGRIGEALGGFEVISEDCLMLVARHFPNLRNPLPGHPWLCLVQADEHSDNGVEARLQAALADAIGDGTARDAAIAQNESQANHFWTVRENVSEAERREGASVKHDIALPVSEFRRFLAEAGPELANALPGARLWVFGHLGDGNLHFNVAAPVGEDPGAFVRDRSELANRIVFDHVHACGGSISAEHGLGQLRRGTITRYKSEVELDLMRRLKAALDPRGTMNPGKLL